MRSDLHRAFRSLARRRTFAVTAVLTLALAFSIPAVVLSTLDRHFWRPLDLPASDRLFTVNIWVEDGYFSPLTHPEYLRLGEVGGGGILPGGVRDPGLHHDRRRGRPSAGGRRAGVRRLLHPVGGGRRGSAACWRRRTMTRAARRR